MTDYLSRRQTAGLGADKDELNAKLDAIARHFGIEWLAAEGLNPLQILWKRQDALSTNELLNFGDAVQGFEAVDCDWLKRQVEKIKSGDDGNRSGAIFELLGLNIYLSAGAKVIPALDSNPGYDGQVELPGPSSLLISIKNHGTTSYERFFKKNAMELDNIFRKWTITNNISAEIRIFSSINLDQRSWTKLKIDIKSILDRQLNGTYKDYKTQGDWTIILKPIPPEFDPISIRTASSIIFIMTPAHKNEQNKFIEDIRKGCANLLKHTRAIDKSACRVLFVRLCATASIKYCQDWAKDYFREYPDDEIRRFAT